MIHKNNVIFKLSERPELRGKFVVVEDGDGYFIDLLGRQGEAADETVNYGVRYICDERQEAANIVKLLEASQVAKKRAMQVIANHMDEQAHGIIDQYIHTANNIKEMMQ